MYAKYSKVISINGAPQDVNEYKLKQHHHVRLDCEFKLDCEIWLQFLTDEMQQVVCRPMMDLFSEPENLREIGFFGHERIGEAWWVWCNFTRQMVKGIGV